MFNGRCKEYLQRFFFYLPSVYWETVIILSETAAYFMKQTTILSPTLFLVIVIRPRCISCESNQFVGLSLKMYLEWCNMFQILLTYSMPWLYTICFISKRYTCIFLKENTTHFFHFRLLNHHFFLFLADRKHVIINVIVVE